MRPINILLYRASFNVVDGQVKEIGIERRKYKKKNVRKKLAELTMS